MIAFALGVLAGVGWLQTRAELPTVGQLWPWAVLAVCAAAGWAGLQMRPRCRAWPGPVHAVLQWLAVVSIGSALGVAWATSTAHRVLGERLPDALDQRSVWLDGVIEDLPTRHDRGWRFEVRVMSATEAADGTALANMPKRGVVNWYGTPSAGLPESLHPGERWQFQARLRQPAGTLNPSGFDVEAWMLEKRLGFTATVQQGVSVPAPRFVGRVSAGVQRIDGWRDRIRLLIAERIPEALPREVIAALVVGDQRAIAPESWTLFQRTGVSHLMSISGLHVTMFAALLGWCAAAGWRAACRTRAAAGLWVPVQSVRALAAACGALGYALLAGFAVPAQRTAYMVTIVCCATLLGIRASPWAVIAFAVLVIVLADPMAVLAPGFWLSFLAVAFLFSLPDSRQAASGTSLNSYAASATPTRKALQWLRGLAEAVRSAGHAQLAITFGLLPVTVLLFQQVIVVGPLANALAIPLVSFVVTPMAMLGVVEAILWPTSVGLTLAAQAQALCEQWLHAVAGLPFSAIDWPSPGLPRVAVASLGMVVVFGHLLRGRATRWRHLGWLGLLALWGVAPPPPAEGSMRLQVMDVGQGSAIVLQTHRHTLLLDTGPAFAASDAGARVILPELRRLGVRALDRVVVTHADRDHSGGLASVAAMMPIAEIMTSRPEQITPLLSSAPNAPTIPIRPCAVGDAWRWDGVQFVVLHPLAHQARTKDTNTDSCVIRAEAADGASVLLTGDITKRSERELVDRFVGLLDPEAPGVAHLIGARLASQVLIAPHHGSKTSSGDDLLWGVRPELVVIQVGFRNRFGHPHSETLERVATLLPGARTVRTDLQGALRIDWPAGRPEATDFWAHHRRYWHLPRSAP